MSANKPYKQIHIGMFRDKARWHSDDDGATWWCGVVFQNITRKELLDMAVGIIKDMPQEEN